MNRIMVAVLGALVLVSAAVCGEELSGTEIIKRTVNPGSVRDMTADLEMRISNKAGQERVRQITLVSKKAAGGGERCCCVSFSPRTSRGPGS